jgi:hypothetical protein
VTRAEFRSAVDGYLALMRASETSGQRTPAHNVLVGGVDYSAHLVGLAVDVVYDELPGLGHAKNWAARLDLLLLREGDHDHLQPASWRAG